MADQTMRDVAVGRRDDWRATAAALTRDFSASPPETPPTSRRYVTAAEACSGLGLDQLQREAAEAGIRSLVSEQAAGFKVARDLIERGIERPVVKELLERGIRMVVEARAAHGVRGLFKAMPPGAGWEHIPGGTKGGFRKRKSGGGYQYAYPDAAGGFTQHDTPSAGEGLPVHEGHEQSTPGEEVRKRAEALETKAAAAGFKLDTSPTSRTTIKHLNELERQLDRAIKAKAGKAKADGAKGDNPKPDPYADVEATPTRGAATGTKDGEPVTVREKSAGEPGYRIPGRGEADEREDDEEPAKPAGEAAAEEAAHRVAHIHATAAKKGIDPKLVRELLDDPEAQTDEGHEAVIRALDALPDLPTDLPDETPDDPAAKRALEEHDAQLDRIVAQMEAAAAAAEEAAKTAPSQPEPDEDERPAKRGDGKRRVYRHPNHDGEGASRQRYRTASKRAAERPSPQRSASKAHAAFALAMRLFGFAAGFAFAGPMGGLLATCMVHNWTKTAVAAAKSLSDVLAPGLYLVADGVVLVKAQAHPGGSGWVGIPGGKRGGYRRPKAGGGWEYWYDDGAAHAEHHAKRAERSRENAERWRETGARPAAIAEAEAQHAEHTALAAAATEAGTGARAKTAETNPHEGKKTLGPDEGKVWTTIADLFAGFREEDGLVNIDDGREVEPTSVTVRSVDGETHHLTVKLEIGSSGGGYLESSRIASKKKGADGEVVLDHANPTQKPHTVVVRLRYGVRNMDEAMQEARHTLAHELAHAMDNLTAAHAKRNRSEYGQGGAAYHNDPTEVVAFRHMLYRELNTPEVAERLKQRRDNLTDDEESEKLSREYNARERADGDDLAGMGYSRVPSLSGAAVSAYLDEYSETWQRIKKYANPDTKRKMLATAAAVLVAHHEDKSEPVKRSLPAAPRIRAAHGENEHGHRDGLLPGQRLAVRKGGGEVVVLPDGAFQWGDNVYPNGRQLLKAVTGREDHRLTVRRYFGLDEESGRLAKAMSDALRAKHPDLLVSVYQGRVRVEGALARYNIPGVAPRDTTALLDVATVQTLLGAAP